MWVMTGLYTVGSEPLKQHAVALVLQQTVELLLTLLLVST